MSKLSPQGYNITQDPTNTNPFWDDTPTPVEPGEGLPEGGSAGQVLTKKSSANYDVEWKTPEEGGSSLPEGGTAGQVLTKTEDGADWETITIPDPLPEGGTVGQVLTKTESGTEWETPDVGDKFPDGGTDGQVLTKTSTGTAWETVEVPDPLPSGGEEGQVLTKTADGVEWETITTPGSLPEGEQADLLVYDTDGWVAKDPGEALAPEQRVGDLLVATGSGGVQWLTESEATPETQTAITDLQTKTEILDGEPTSSQVLWGTGWSNPYLRVYSTDGALSSFLETDDESLTATFTIGLSMTNVLFSDLVFGCKNVYKMATVDDYAVCRLKFQITPCELLAGPQFGLLFTPHVIIDPNYFDTQLSGVTGWYYLSQTTEDGTITLKLTAKNQETWDQMTFRTNERMSFTGVAVDTDISRTRL